MFSQASRDILTARGFRPVETPSGSALEQWACSGPGVVVSILHNEIERNDRRQFSASVGNVARTARPNSPKGLRTADERAAVAHAVAALEFHRAFGVVAKQFSRAPF